MMMMMMMMKATVAVFKKKKRNVLPVLVEQNGYFVVLTFKGNK